MLSNKYEKDESNDLDSSFSYLVFFETEKKDFADQVDDTSPYADSMVENLEKSLQKSLSVVLQKLPRSQCKIYLLTSSKTSVKVKISNT